MRRFHPIVTAVVLALLAGACGSTVHGAATAGGVVPQNQPVGDGADGFTVPSDVAAASQAPAATERSSAAATGSTPGAGPSAAGASGASQPATTTSTADQPAEHSVGDAPGRGVTEHEVRIGIVTASPGAGEALAAMGFDVAVGDPEARWRVLVDDLNRRGGIAGRTVVAEFAFVDTTSTQPAQQFQAACTALTQDTPVHAVTSDMIYDQTFAACLQAADTPVLTGGVPLDREGMTAAPLSVATQSPDLSRLVAALAAGLDGMGYFQAPSVAQPTRVGLLRVDDPAFERAAHELDQALAGRGLRLDAEVAVSPVNAGDYGSIFAQISNAVLAFRSAGITHVLFLSINATEPVLFMRVAESQAYEPRYGLSSQQAPSALPDVVSPSQLDDAMGIGWSPVFDVPESRDPGDAPRQQQCLQIMRDGGQAVAARTEQLLATVQCDGLWVLAEATGLAGSPGGTAFREAVRGLGVGYASAAVFATDFAGFNMGASTWRGFAWDPGCGCMAYTASRGTFD